MPKDSMLLPVGPGGRTWYCLRCKLTGQIALQGTDENHQFVGPVSAFYDHEEAELAASAYRETHPFFQFEAIPLPAVPPDCLRPDPVAAFTAQVTEVASFQFELARLDERVWVELRPRSGTKSTLLAATVEEVIRRLAREITGLRASPVWMLTYGRAPEAA